MGARSIGIALTMRMSKPSSVRFRRGHKSMLFSGATPSHTLPLASKAGIITEGATERV